MSTAGCSLEARRSLRGLIAAVALVALAGCGTTVPLTGGVAQTGSGLTPAGIAANPHSADPALTNEGTSSEANTGVTGTGRSTNDGSPSGPGGVLAQPGQSQSALASGTTAAVTRPIQIGFLTYDGTKGASAIGYSGSSTDSGSVEAVWKRLVAGINATGGLSGRKINAVYYTVDGTAADYSSADQAACAYFTQDHKVDIVAVASVAPTQPFQLANCLKQAGVAEFWGSPGQISEKSLASMPNVLMHNGISTDRQATAVIEQMRSVGWLTSKDKVGVIRDTCPGNADVYKGTVAPLLARYGIAHEEYAAWSCATGFGVAADASAGSQNAVLRFRSDGVTKVMYLTGAWEVIGNLTFSNSAENQGWRPGYMLSSFAQVESFKGQMAPGQLANMKGVGWVPPTDLWTGKLPDTAARRACSQLMKAGGYTYTPKMDEGGIASFVLAACDAVRLMRTVLERTHGVANWRTLISGASGLVGFSEAATFGPTNFKRPGGASQGAPWSFAAACACVQYTASPRAL